MKVALLVDVSNLYYCISHKYEGKKLNYKALLDFVREMGPVLRAKAYGSQINGGATGFITALEKVGYETAFKTPREYSTDSDRVKRKADWDVGIAMDMVNLSEQRDIDTIVLGTADGDMGPAVEACIQRGVKVIVIGCGISGTLKGLCDCIEIPRSLLEVKHEG